MITKNATPELEPAPELVLSTLNRDGTRRWLDPRPSPGRFLSRRRWVAYILLLIYNAIPWIPINGKPAILLDIASREFTFFGATFLPTDTLLVALLLAIVFVTVFLATALFGRVWCGWACPQTVYMEFVFRPIERLFLGRTPAARKKHASTMPVRRALMYITFVMVAFHLAHTFLAYFVGAGTVIEWSFGSPLAHPWAFALVLAVTGLILLDFGFFREQICIVCCPYGRLQSVMLDRSSLIVTYDESRGEPRGKARRRTSGDVTLPQFGDCIDCHMCVTTCPTGIDIRDGLQMECIGCAQCIDACDAVMDKIKRPRGLIRYSSQDAVANRARKRLRPRVVVYPAMLVVLVSGFIGLLVTQADADVKLIRATGRPFETLSSGNIANEVGITIVNRTDGERTYQFEPLGLPEVELRLQGEPPTLAPGEMTTAMVTIVTPPTVFRNGRANITIIVRDDHDFIHEANWRLQGPFGTRAVHEDPDQQPLGEDE